MIMRPLYIGRVGRPKEELQHAALKRALSATALPLPDRGVVGASTVAVTGRNWPYH
jgi:hypothetical protein